MENKTVNDKHVGTARELRLLLAHEGFQVEVDYPDLELEQAARVLALEEVYAYKSHYYLRELGERLVSIYKATTIKEMVEKSETGPVAYPLSVFEKSGEFLRFAVTGIPGGKLVHGVTNKMIAKYSYDVHIANPEFVMMFDGDTLVEVPYDFIRNVIRIMHTNRHYRYVGEEPVVEKVERKENVTMNDDLRVVASEQTAGIKVNPVADEELKQLANSELERLTKLQANGVGMDKLDYSILFLRSSQWAFVIVLVGILAQGFHIFHVVRNLSDLQGFAQWANALVWAWFFSFGLAYFTLRAGTVDKKTDREVYRSYIRKVNWLIIFDVFANLYYWSYKFMLMPAVLSKYTKDFEANDGRIYSDVDWEAVNWLTFDITKIQWPQMIGGVVFSFAIPFILKAFAGEVKLPSWLDFNFRSYGTRLS